MAGYGTDAGFAAWMDENGHVLPEGALSPSVLRQRGSTYVDALYGSRFAGYPTGGASQERSWPRTGVFAMGGAVAANEIPAAVLNASYAAAFVSTISTGALTLSTSAPVKRRKVGDVETEFAEISAGFQWAGDIPVTVLDGMLAPFLLPRTNLLIRSIG